MSAQESRRKKKDYVDSLERQYVNFWISLCWLVFWNLSYCRFKANVVPFKDFCGDVLMLCVVSCS